MAERTLSCRGSCGSGRRSTSTGRVRAAWLATLGNGDATLRCRLKENFAPLCSPFGPVHGDCTDMEEPIC